MSDTSPPISANLDSSKDGAQLQDILPFTIGTRVFGIFSDQVDGTGEAKPFARVPRTPSAVVGIVCLRGRMLTVLDAAAVLKAETRQWPQPLPFVIALQGNEQLGLVADACGETITISAEDIKSGADGAADPETPVVGTVKHGGEEILIFDARRVFEYALPRRERRRRRF